MGLKNEIIIIIIIIITLFLRDNGWISFSLALSACLVHALSNRVRFISVRGVSRIPFPLSLIFAWIFFSRVNSQVCTRTVPLLISPAAPRSVAGLWPCGGERRRRPRGSPAPADLTRPRPERRPRRQSVLPRVWLLPPSLGEHADFISFFFLIKSIMYQKIN